LLHLSYKNNDIKGIGFRKSSSDQKAKMKSLAGFTAIIIEEAEEINEDDFNQLDESLRKIGVDIKIILLFNLPPKNHWINKRWFNLVESEVEGFYVPQLKESMKDNTCYIHTTYKDNEKHLNKSAIELYEGYKTSNPDHYWNMIMGLVPTGKRGLIFKNWKPITAKEFEDLPYESFYGLDFGFTNDPTALVEIKQHNEKVWFRELIYETGLLNQSISHRMGQLGVKKTAKIYADSAEPKSIEELKKEGWDVEGAVKGAGSVNAGLDMLLSKEGFYTDDSKNLIREKENYCWAMGKDKEPTNDPIDDFNHLMDGCRYGVYSKSQEKIIGFF
jgi:phage terminase large subunit